MVIETEHATLGTIPIVNRPFRFAGADQQAPEAPPALGQHTDTILSDLLELDGADIARLRAAGVVA
jgi:formyl-CoA transferase